MIGRLTRVVIINVINMRLSIKYKIAWKFFIEFLNRKRRII